MRTDTAQAPVAPLAVIVPVHQAIYLRKLPAPPPAFTIFEGTSEIQRMITGRTVTGLDVR